jgi:parallel beta-helix repeat protein
MTSIVEKKLPVKKIAALVAAVCSFLPFSAAYAIHYNGPLVVDAHYIKKHGGVITGNYQGTQTNAAITITNASSPVTISSSNLTGPGDLIYIANSNVTVTNTTGSGTNPNIAGTAKGMFVHAINPSNLSVTKCNVSNVSFGVSVTGYSGNFKTGQTISILDNVFNNIDGRPSNGTGGYAASGSFNAHGIQLSNINSLAGMEIGWNQIVNVPFQSQSAEVIETIDVSGTASSPLLIHDNYVQGAYPANPGVDGYSGGGIMLNGTSTDTVGVTSAYTNVYNNQIVSTANMGIAIAAGHNNNVYNNRVVSSGYVSTGTKSLIAFSTAIGMYNWNYYALPPTVFFSNLIQTNVVGLIRKSTTGAPVRGDLWLPGQTTNNNTSFLPNNDTSPTLADEATEYQNWLVKLKNHNNPPV